MDALIFVTTPPSRKATTTNTQILVAQEKADAANDTAAADADDLNVSMNRGERLKAIEQRIAKLKSDADTKAAAALSAASEAQDVRDSLDALRVQGENRRAEMGIGTTSYLHNGGEWYLTAPAYGLRVDHNPQVGAAISFLPGQDGADGSYGHVAVVEAVYGDGTFLISEMNWGGPFLMHSRVLVNRGQYWFVH